MAEGFSLRLPGWEARLARLFEAARTRGGLVFGDFDCVSFARDGFVACRGEAAAQALGLPEWSCERTAFAAIRAGGGNLATCLALALKRAGLKYVIDGRGNPGNIGLMALRGRLGASVTLRGPDNAWFTVCGEAGLMPVPAGAILQEWAV